MLNPEMIRASFLSDVETIEVASDFLYVKMGAVQPASVLRLDAQWVAFFVQPDLMVLFEI